MWFNDFISNCWVILKESAVFILVGFLIAGVLHVLFARGNWANWLRGLKSRSVFLAAAIGLPLPLCSCSVLPAAVSLRRQGASKGATLSFLISTPETSVQSVLLTYSLLGPFMALFRPLAACITAIAAGLIENFTEKRFPEESSDNNQEADCCSCKNDASNRTSDQAKKVTWMDGQRHAFVTIFDDVVGWMLLGIIAGAVIQAAVPGFVMDAMFGSPLQSMLVMLVIGVPLYVCAELSTPIAAVLIAQGVSPGAALVFLLAGPATNIGSVGLLLRQLGKRTVIIYLATIMVISIIAGLAVDSFFASRQIDLADRVLAEPFLPEWVKSAGAILFVVMCAGSFVRLSGYDWFIGLLDKILPVKVTRRRMSITVFVAIIAGYFLSGLFVIDPGQVGIVRRFGKIVRHDIEPGLHYCLPYPIDALDKIDTKRVYRLVLGYNRTADGYFEEDAGEAWVLLGDENIGNLKSVTHWHMQAGQTIKFAYSSADREQVVAGAIRGAIRRIMGGTNIETVLTTDRDRVANEVLLIAQQSLDRCECGITLGSFDFMDLHVPAEVHGAFRDVASALEDKTTRENEALTYREEALPRARGLAQRAILTARGYGLRTIAEAGGEAKRFTLTREAYGIYPHTTRIRLLMEMYDRVLPGLRKCVRPNSKDLLLEMQLNGRSQKKIDLPQ